MSVKVFGLIEGVPVGAVFKDRREVRDAGIHLPNQAGIHGTKAEGADSIVVSGGYVDDQDSGDVIIYTGAGGNDTDSKRQISDQSIEQSGNAGLITSELNGYPVRVVRGRHPGSAHAPAVGYRFDGLYAVVSHWEEPGRDGFNVVRFRLEKLDDERPENGPAGVSDASEPEFRETTISRRVRDSKASRTVKLWHGFKCQVCGDSLVVDGGRPYAEGAHIRPLGRPHRGPDETSNILCLCPNHHVMLDHGGLSVSADLTVCLRQSGEVVGKLRTAPEHQLDLSQFAYHRASVHPYP